jgi:hypothetical protein
MLGDRSSNILKSYTGGFKSDMGRELPKYIHSFYFEVPALCLENIIYFTHKALLHAIFTCNYDLQNI